MGLIRSFDSMTILLIIAVLFVSLYFLKLLFRRNGAASPGGGKLLRPPGSTGWPIIGEGLDFLKMSRTGVLEKFFFDRTQKYSSEIFSTALLGENITFLGAGGAGNKFLFSNEFKLVNSWWPPAIRKIIPNAQQASTEQESKTLRKLYSQFFKPDALHRYICIMDLMTRRHFENSWDNKEEVTVYPLVKNYTFSVACSLFLSIDDQGRVDELHKPFSAMLDGFIALPINLPGTRLNRAIKASNVIRKEIISVIKQRKNNLSEKEAIPTQDTLSQIILFSDEDTGKFMTEMYIADLILGLLIAGHDTTTSVITMVLKYIAEHPDVYSEVLKEQIEIAKSKATGDLLNWADMHKMRYSWNVACEVMRLAPPTPGGFKQATTDFTYAGYSFPKGWKFHWSIISTHKNPENFPDPETFDPSRFDGNGPAPYTFVPFGGGPRVCPAQEFARLQILTFMHHLVRRYKWERLHPSDEKLIFKPLALPAKGLPIRLHHHEY
ncbi:Cytochrome P450 [Macleaya cordata]|uniref:Cytochrome P450 n=1 Tax=Macleaya cordata TaxID=56857 RepID=A0A200PUV9_MACCD|nr:Cytochrome P450 [Macleaya cordata]